MTTGDEEIPNSERSTHLSSQAEAPKASDPAQSAASAPPGQDAQATPLGAKAQPAQAENSALANADSELFGWSCSGIANNLWVTVSMAGLIGWSGCWSVSSWTLSIPAFLLIACGVICFLLLFIIKRDAVLTGSLSAVVLIVFAAIGAIGDNIDVSRLLPFDGTSFISSNRERWEVVALVSTAFMAIIYLDAIDVIKGYFGRRRGFLGINTIVFCLLASTALIGFALRQLHDPNKHYLLVWLVTILFCIVDWYISWSFKSKPRRAIAFAKESKTLLWLIDLPVFAALTVLGLFVFYHLDCTADALNGPVSGSGTFGEALSNNVCVEAYPFLAGALAFQMLSYNVIYIVFSFRLHITE
jgi:hypothetical protein